MSERIPYDDMVISNLVDPEINTMSRLMGQYLIENIHAGKNILITGSAKSGRTLLLNVIGKHIDRSNKIMSMGIKQELMFFEHTTEYLNVENYALNERVKEYFFITKGFPFYAEYNSYVLDDLPKGCYINYYHLLMSKKQVLTIINDESCEKAIQNLHLAISHDFSDKNIDQIGANLMERIDIIVHIRRYQDDYIRIKEISETEFYDPNQKKIVLTKKFEYVTNNKVSATNGRLIGDFLRSDVNKS